VSLFPVMTATPVRMTVVIPPSDVNILKLCATMTMNVLPTPAVLLKTDVSTRHYLATILMPALPILAFPQPDAQTRLLNVRITMRAL